MVRFETASPQGAQEDVEHAYRQILGREPDEGGLRHWLGEVEATEEQLRALIRTMAFDDRWTMAVEDPSKKPPRPRKPKA